MGGHKKIMENNIEPCFKYTWNSGKEGVFGTAKTREEAEEKIKELNSQYEIRRVKREQEEIRRFNRNRDLNYLEGHLKTILDPIITDFLKEYDEETVETAFDNFSYDYFNKGDHD